MKSRKRIIRYSLLTANLALLVLVVFFVAKSPATSQSSRQAAASYSLAADDELVGPLDQPSTADIAVHIARVAGLPEAVSVVNHADDVSAVDAKAPADISVIAKPQVASAALPSKNDIHIYTVEPGDTISSIATKFGTSSDSIKWSNSLTGNSVSPGKQLVLPPKGVNGIVYNVKQGDTPESLAQRYSTDKDLLISFNDAEVKGLVVGERILIPNGTIQAPVARASYDYYSGFAWGGTSAVYTANGYDYGWCTWHAANRRSQSGRPIPSNLGNARSWKSLAQLAGLAVDGNPSAGDVAYYKNIGGLGHVGYVEQVNEDGSIWISDMNYSGVSQIGGSTPAGGWGRISYHQVMPEQLGGFLFIH